MSEHESSTGYQPQEIETAQEQSKEYLLGDGLIVLRQQVEKLYAARKRPILVLVAGGSASGKTTQVAERLAHFFPTDSVVISMDNYYHGANHLRQTTREEDINWHIPNAVNLTRLSHDLGMLRNGQIINSPMYSMKESEVIGTQSIDPSGKKVIVVEGVFVLNESLINLGDIRVFVEANAATRMSRRIARDIIRKGFTSEEIEADFTSSIQPMHDKHIEPTRANADIIIINNEQQSIPR